MTLPNHLPKSNLFVHIFDQWEITTFSLLQASGFGQLLKNQKTVLIKPNLVSTQKPPVTTPVELVSAIVDFIQQNDPGITIIVGEGTGTVGYTTWRPFKELGYIRMAKEKGIDLIDLNDAELMHVRKPECRRFSEMHLPKICLESFLVSVPVLKAHSFSGVTLSMKNMIGIAPPLHYQVGGSWKKSAFHDRIEEAIFDLNQYKKPDFTVLDATIGMPQAHLWGATCDPPVNRLIAGKDPVAVDAYGARLLQRDWRKIGHIVMANGILGNTETENIVL